jgi:hypothetical protein
MKIKRINRGAFNTFWIILSLVGIVSFNITKDWATVLSQGLVAGFSFVLIYIVGYLNGVDEGKGKGYDKAMEDLKPVLPPEIQKNMNVRNVK